MKYTWLPKGIDHHIKMISNIMFCTEAIQKYMNGVKKYQIFHCTIIELLKGALMISLEGKEDHMLSNEKIVMCAYNQAQVSKSENIYSK